MESKSFAFFSWLEWCHEDAMFFFWSVVSEVGCHCFDACPTGGKHVFSRNNAGCRPWNFACCFIFCATHELEHEPYFWKINTDCSKFFIFSWWHSMLKHSNAWRGNSLTRDMVLISLFFPWQGTTQVCRPKIQLVLEESIIFHGRIYQFTCKYWNSDETEVL